MAIEPGCPPFRHHHLGLDRRRAQHRLPLHTGPSGFVWPAAAWQTVAIIIAGQGRRCHLGRPCHLDRRIAPRARHQLVRNVHLVGSLAAAPLA